MFQAKFHLLDTANRGLLVIVKRKRKKNKPLTKSHKSKFSIDLQQLNPEKHVAMPIMSLSKSASMRTTIPVQNVFTLETKKLIILV